MNITRKFALIVFLFALLLTALPALALSQRPPTDLTVRVNDIDVSDFPEVVLALTVRDATGVSIADLDKGDFEINEDRKPYSRPIKSVRSRINPDLPVSLVLVLDTSGSMAGKPLEDARIAIRTLVEQLGDDDDVALLAFSNSVALDDQDDTREVMPSTDPEVLLGVLDNLAAEGGTPLYDALYKGVRWAEEAPLGHRAVILLTDGIDEEPGSVVASSETPIQEAIRANIPVFTLGLGNRIDRGYLQRVARITGGTYQETPDSEQLTELFLNVLAPLKQQYLVTYTSDLKFRDAQEHRVQVHIEINNRLADVEAVIPRPDRLPTATPEPVTVAPGETFVSRISRRFRAGVIAWNPEIAEVTPTPAPTSTPQPTPTPRPPLLASPVVRWGLLCTPPLLVLLLIILYFALRRGGGAQQEYCLNCYHPLAPGEVCPNCGPEAERFVSRAA